MFFVAQFEFGEDGLLGENVLRQIEFQVDAREHDARKDAGDQNAGKRASENHEEQVVAGIHRREDEDRRRPRDR